MLFIISAVFLWAPAGATLQGLQTGMELPDLSLRTIPGETVKLSKYMGEKLTVVVFWSTWSKNSEKALARMQQLYRQYGTRGLTVIGVNADEQRVSGQIIAAVKAQTDALKLTFPVFVDQGLAAFRDAGVIALPTTIILDRERVIRFELSGYPLTGAEDLADFVGATLDGNKPAALAARQGRQPDRNSLRYFNMGVNTLKSKRMADTAETWFKKAIGADARFVQPRLSLGRLYLQKGDVAAAKAQFQGSLAVEPDNVVALCEMGMILANEGKPAEGEALFARTLKTDAAYTPCYYYGGYILGKKGDLAKALERFDAARSINPADHNILIYKARMYEENRMLKEAAEAYRKALELLLKSN